MGVRQQNTFCGTCKREIRWTADPKTFTKAGRPHGWYRLIQRVPLRIQEDGNRLIGWYCTPNCLAHAVLALDEDPINKEFEAE